MTKTQEVIQAILKSDPHMTRAEIARQMRTSWSMVGYWCAGTHNAGPQKMKQLKKLIRK